MVRARAMMRLLGTHTRLGAEFAVCIGAFDGLHAGHRALLAAARAQAPKVAVVSFEPHPLAVIAPERAPPRLQTPRQKARVARALGVDALVLLPFDATLAATSPVAFARDTLARDLAPRTVVVGPDFRYGARRAGTASSLREDLHAVGVQTHVATLLESKQGEKLGSTGIRRALLEGDLTSASDALCRLHAVEGLVVRGAGRGRTIGFRTANIRSDGAMAPRDGVYACRVQVTDPSSSHFGAVWAGTASLGSNPTFADGRDTTTGLEVHVHDVDLGESLYGVRVEVGFVTRLRDTTSFSSVAALVTQIERDVADSRARLAATSPSGGLQPDPTSWPFVPPGSREEEAAFDPFFLGMSGPEENVMADEPRDPPPSHSATTTAEAHER